MNDFKTAKLDGQDILKDGISGIYYTHKEWRKLSTSDDSRYMDGVHGRSTSPTYARVRIITLEGYIDRLGNDKELEALQYLEKVLVLQTQLGSLQKRELYIKDVYDQEWKINVKIKDPLEVVEGDDNFIGSHYKWRVVLESTDKPIYKSYEELLVSGDEGNIGGFSMPNDMPISWDEYHNIIECQASGNISSDARFEIIARGNVASPLVINDITNDTFFGLDISASDGDTIIVDSENKTITKNGTNILGDRISGSIWPSILGTTQFIVEDKDGGILNEELDVKVYFSNSLL